jgi:hypothetical protein
MELGLVRAPVKIEPSGIDADDLDLGLALVEPAADAEIVPPVPTEMTIASISPPVCSQISAR